jgi:hypothetical protein
VKETPSQGHTLYRATLSRASSSISIVPQSTTIAPRSTWNSRKTDTSQYPSASNISSELSVIPEVSEPESSEPEASEAELSVPFSYLVTEALKRLNQSQERSTSPLTDISTRESTVEVPEQHTNSSADETNSVVTPAEDLRSKEQEIEVSNMTGNNNTRGLPLSGSPEAPTTLTKDQTIYGIAEFWDKCIEIFRIRDRTLIDNSHMQDLRNALLAYMDPWARRLYKNDYAWNKAEDVDQLKDAFFKPWPGAKDVASGSVKVLENLMRRYSGLNLNTADAALQYCRDFKAEANELMSKPNCKLTNYQLVNMFEKCLDKTTREAIRVALTLNKAYREAQLKNRNETPAPAAPAGENAAQPAVTAPQVERGTIDWSEFDDWEWYLEEAMIYFSQDLVDVAMHVHTTSRVQDMVPRVILTRNKEVKLEDSEIDDIRQNISHLKDVNETNKKFFSQQSDTISKIWSHIQSQQKVNQGWTPGVMDNRQYGGGSIQTHNHDHQSRGRSGPTCFFCGGEHMVGDCQHVQDYISQGKLMKDPQDGRFKLPDGRGIPGSRETLWKKRLDDYWKDKLPSAPNSSLLFYGEEDVLVEQYKNEFQQLQSLKQELMQLKQGQSLNSNNRNSAPVSQMAFQSQDSDIDYQRLAMQLLQQNLARVSTSGSEGF